MRSRGGGRGGRLGEVVRRGEGEERGGEGGERGRGEHEVFLARLVSKSCPLSLSSHSLMVAIATIPTRLRDFAWYVVCSGGNGVVVRSRRDVGAGGVGVAMTHGACSRNTLQSDVLSFSTLGLLL